MSEDELKAIEAKCEDSDDCNDGMSRAPTMTDECRDLIAEVRRLRFDNDAFRERLRPACEMLLAKGETEVFNVLTGNGVHVPLARRDVLADNERLRGLIKTNEWAGYHETAQGDEGVCPWCEVERAGGSMHLKDCPAFTPEGEVR